MSDNELNQDDLAEWRAIAQRCLDDPTMPASTLEAAFLALQKDDPQLAKDCFDGALRRKNQQAHNN